MQTGIETKNKGGWIPVVRQLTQQRNFVLKNNYKITALADRNKGENKVGGTTAALAGHNL